MIGTDTDSIYQYNTVSNWQQQALLTHSTRASGDSFGIAIAINKTGDEVVIGASGDDDRGAQSGTAWIFTRSGLLGQNNKNYCLMILLLVLHLEYKLL